MRSYFFKNFIIAASVVLLAFFILGASFLGFGRSYMLSERKHSIEQNVEEVSVFATAYSQTGYIGDFSFRMVLSALSKTSGNQYIITDLKGTVISCSDSDLRCHHLGSSIDPAIISALASTGSYSQLGNLGGFYPETHYVAALPIVGGTGQVMGYVFSSSNASQLIYVWSTLFDIFIVSTLIIMAVSLIISFIAARRQAQPIHEMALASRRFAHGDFSVRVSGDDRHDEIGALAASFNQMAESLEQADIRRSDFLANVSHELKTPMTTISGFADGILDGTIPPESQRRYLETISAETKRLNRLVRRMLSLSRMQSQGPEEIRKNSFDVREVLVETLLIFEKNIVDKSLDVDVSVPDDGMMVCGDRDSINQVIYNLLENAVKFAYEGSMLSLSLFKQGTKAYISVKNVGDTIPEEDLPLIFERFHKSDRSRSMDRDGVGLGLYIVKTIIGSHGEDIAVTSRDGVTEFVFSLTLKK